MKLLLFLLLASAVSSAQGLGGKGGVGGKAGLGGGPPGVGAITLVQAVIGQTASGAHMTAAYTNNTAGHISTVGIVWCSATGTPITISTVADTAGNTYTISAASKSTVVGTHYADCNVEYAYNTSILTFTGTNTVTVTFSGTISPGGAAILIRELTHGSFDQTSAGTGATAATPNMGSITTTNNGSYAIAIGVIDDGFGFGTGWFNAVAPFTLGSQGGGGNLDLASEVFAQTTAGALTPTFTSNFSGTTGPTVGSSITFHP